MDQEERPLNATTIGEDFIREYFTVLHQTPRQAWRYYAKHGQFSTVYLDGTTFVAENPEDLNLLLMRHATPDTQAILVTSVLSVYDTPTRFLVQATGKRFVQSFVIDYRPTQQRRFTILTSIATHTTLETIEITNKPSAGTNAIRHSSDTTAGRPPVVVTIQDNLSVTDDMASELLPLKTSTVKSITNRVHVADGIATEQISSVVTTELPPSISKCGEHSASDTVTESIPSETTKERESFERMKRVHCADDIAAERIPSVTTAERPAHISNMNRRSYSEVVSADLPLIEASAGRRPPEIVAREIPAANLCNLFVGRLPKTMTTQNLSDTFSVYGQVMSVNVKEGFGRNGAPTKYNYGFVKFDRPASAQNALANRPIKLDNGHVLNLQLSST